MPLCLIFHESDFHNLNIVKNISFFIFDNSLIFFQGYIYIYIYIYIKLATWVEVNPKAHFSVPTTPRFWKGASPFPGLLHFTLNPYLIMLCLARRHQVWFFLVFSMTRHGIEPQSPRPMSNTIYIYICVCVFIYIYIYIYIYICVCVCVCVCVCLYIYIYISLTHEYEYWLKSSDSGVINPYFELSSNYSVFLC